MRKKTNRFILLLLVSAVFLMSFQQDTSRVNAINKLLEEAIGKKTDRYRNSRIKKCKQRIMEEAGKRADSIIISRAKALKVIQDTFARPNAPVRPERPELLEAIDSSSPVPLLENGEIKEIDN